MSLTPRSGRLRLWISVGVVALLLGGAVSAGALFLASSTPPSDDAVPPAAPVAASTPTATVPAEDTGSWADDLPVPPGATEEERRQVELSYSLVAVDDDRADSVRQAASGAIGAQSVQGTTYFAVPAAEIDAVRTALPEAEVTPNRLVETEADQSPAPSWGLDAVDTAAGTLDTHYFFDTTGAGTTVYVVDTGIQSTHPDFGGRVDAANGHTEVTDGNGTEDCNGHGTHVAGTVGSTTYGVAKATRLVPVRVMGCDGKGTFISFVYGLIWIYNTQTAGRAVITMSLGLPRNDTANQLVQIGVDDGWVITSAAGNDTDDACKYSPGSASPGITVGAIDAARALAWYSNYGTCVTLFAPGSDITSTWIGSSTNTISGTSMATPHVAGLAARLLQEHPSWGTAAVKAALTTTPGAGGTLTGLPAGSPNIFAAIPGIPRLTSLTAATDPAGVALAWATNDIGTFTTFSLTVTDTTTGREYPVVVSGGTTSTVFTDVVAHHAYQISATATVRMPTGTVTTNTVNTSFAAGG